MLTGYVVYSIPFASTYWQKKPYFAPFLIWKSLYLTTYSGSYIDQMCCFHLYMFSLFFKRERESKHNGCRHAKRKDRLHFDQTGNKNMIVDMYVNMHTKWRAKKRRKMKWNERHPFFRSPNPDTMNCAHKQAGTIEALVPVYNIAAILLSRWNFWRLFKGNPTYNILQQICIIDDLWPAYILPTTLVSSTARRRRYVLES